jgi:hypothetical protein|tara:strand:- start:316 stop:2070 length:1755 start_codon:yes stop_codon:yes gene_type:complete
MATLEERLAAAAKAESTPDWSEVPGQAFENAPESAGRLASGIWEMITNPVDTAVAVGDLAKGVASKLIPGLELDETAANNFGKYIVDRYGGDEGDSFAGLRRSVAKDPVGVIADLSALVTGGSMAAAKGAMVVSKVAGSADKAARAAFLSDAAGRVPAIASAADIAGTGARGVASAAEATSRGLDKVAKAASYADPVALPFRAAGGAIKGVKNPDAKLLFKEGVSPTMGQILGGTAGRLEETIGTVPVLGSAIAAGRNRAAGQFNQAARNRALNPIGETADKRIVGSGGVDEVSSKLSLAYDDLLPKVTLTPDTQLLDDIIKAAAEAKKTIGPDAAKSLDKILENQLMPHLSAPIGGVKFKAVEEALGKLGENFGGSNFPDQRIVGDAISDVQTALKDALARSNPQHAAELKSINEGYANYVRLRGAQKADLAGDDFTPSQYASSVRSSDKSVGKGNFARGRALGQDLSSAGVRVLGDKVRSSGTAERGAVLGVGGAAATGSIPFVEPMTAALMAASAVPYAPGIQRGMAAALLKGQKWRGPMGGAVQKLGPAVGRAGYQSTQPQREEDELLQERLRQAVRGAR